MIIDQWIAMDFTYPVEDAQCKILNCQLHILSPTSRYWGIPSHVGNMHETYSETTHESQGL